MDRVRRSGALRRRLSAARHVLGSLVGETVLGVLKRT
jgi:hypothetical protein